MKVCYFFWNEETNYDDKFSCFMLLVLSMIDSLRLKLSILYWMERSTFLVVYAQKKMKVYFFSDYRMKNKSRSQDQLLDIISFVPIASDMPQPQGPIMLRKPALYQRMLSRKEKRADQDIGLEGV